MCESSEQCIGAALHRGHQDSVVAYGLRRELGAAAPAEGAFGWLVRD